MPNNAREERPRWGDALFRRMAPPMRPIAKLEVEGKRGEELFNLILSGIREIYDVDAVIAGGSVRDYVAGVKQPKDVDVFIPLPTKQFLVHCEELGWQDTPQLVQDGAYKKNKTGKGVGCFFPTIGRGRAYVQDVPVDLVFLEKPLTQENVETFPVFAQRGIYTLGGGLSLAPEAKEDVAKKQFTIDPTITDTKRLQAVLEKVRGWKKRKEYSDWKIVEPEHKEWWEVKKEAEKTEKEKLKLSVWDVYEAEFQKKLDDRRAREELARLDVDNPFRAVE